MSGEAQQALDAAQPFLPYGYRWSNLLFPPLVLAVSFVAAALAGMIVVWPLRRVSRSDWISYARHAYVANFSLGMAAVVLPAVVATMTLLAGRSPFSAFQGRWLTLASAVAAYLGALFWQFYVRRHTHGDSVRFATWFRGHLAQWLLFRTAFPIAVLVLLLIPSRDSPWALILPFLGAAILAGLAMRGLLTLAHRVGLVRRASERLDNIVRRVAAREGVPLGNVYEGRLAHANAAALPGTGDVLVATELLEAMTDEEIEAICAHEVGHLKEARRVAVLRAGSVGLLVLSLTLWFGLSVYGMWALLAGAWLPLAIARLGMPYWRRLEARSDAVAHSHGSHDHDQAAYASALERLHRLNFVPPVVFGKGQTHPHLYDRLVAVGRPPSYPRPARPSVGRLYVSLIPVAAAAFVLMMVHAALVHTNGQAGSSLPRLAREHFDRGELETAALLWRAGAAADPSAAIFPATGAIERATLGACEDAKVLLDIARPYVHDPQIRERVRLATEQMDLRCREAPKRGSAASPFGVR